MRRGYGYNERDLWPKLALGFSTRNMYISCCLVVVFLYYIVSLNVIFRALRASAAVLRRSHVLIRGYSGLAGLEAPRTVNTETIPGLVISDEKLFSTSQHSDLQ